MINRFFQKNDMLLLSTTAYILLPVFIFFALWTRVVFTIAFVALILWFLYSQRNSFVKNYQAVFDKSQKIKLAIILVFLFILVILSGAGGIIAQTSDYDKHNAILRDLITHNNPAIIKVPEGESGLLVYYIAYYLPSVVVGKLFGFNAAAMALMLWTYLGVVIGVMWLFRIFKKVSFLPIIVFTFFSGFDIFGTVVSSGRGGLKEIMHKEWWMSPFTLQISSTSSLLNWVPHMFIPAFMLTMLLYFYKDEKAIPDVTYLLVAASFLWSPFICLGLLPFFAYPVIRRLKHSGIKNIISLPSLLCCALMSAVTLLYITSSSTSGFDLKLVFFAYDVSLREIFTAYLMFMLFEVGLLFVLLKNTTQNKKVLYFTMVIFIASTLIHGGANNDFCMRVTIPAFIILFILFTEVFINALNNKKIVVSAICCIMVFLMSYTAINDIAARLIVTDNLFGNYYDELKSVANYHEDHRIYRDQYISLEYSDSLFAKLIMKQK